MNALKSIIAVIRSEIGLYTSKRALNVQFFPKLHRVMQICNFYFECFAHATLGYRNFITNVYSTSCEMSLRKLCIKSNKMHLSYLYLCVVCNGLRGNLVQNSVKSVFIAHQRRVINHCHQRAKHLCNSQQNSFHVERK